VDELPHRSRVQCGGSGFIRCRRVHYTEEHA
jgi:hypothetical protein